MTAELEERVEVPDGRQNRPRWRLVAIVVAPLLLFALLLASGLGRDPRELPSELEGEPAPGLLFFAAVVVLTMLAVESFDPRLIWDSASSREVRHA